MAINKTSTSFIGLLYRAVVNDDLAVVALFCVLALLASFYFVTRLPFSVEDATFLAAWL
jgi:hypothetical protein